MLRCYAVSRRFLFLLLAAALTAGGSAPAAAAKKSGGAGDAPPPPVKVERHVLDNGMTFLFVRNPQSPTVATFIQFKVGSVDERPGITGMAHFLEHMVFKGSKATGTKDYEKEAPMLARQNVLWAEMRKERAKGEKADKALLASMEKEWEELSAALRELVIEEELWTLYTEHGGTFLNASTGMDTTQYYVSLPSNKMELFAWLESDRFMDPVFRDFYPERYVVMEERRMRYDTQPDGTMYEMLSALAYMAHPYGLPTIGWMSDLEAIRIEDMYDFFRAYYAPNNAVAALVGDVNPATLMPMFKRYFERWPAQAEPRPVDTVEPPQRGERRAIIEFPAKPRLLIGWKVTDALHPDAVAVECFAPLLTEGRTSRLYRRLVERERIAASIESAVWPPTARYPALYYIEAVPQGGSTTADLEAAIYEEISRVAEEGVEPWELEKIRNALDAALVRTMSNNMSLAIALASYETLGGWEKLFEKRQRVRAITSDDIRSAARRYLAANQGSIVTLVEQQPDASTWQAAAPGGRP